MKVYMSQKELNIDYLIYKFSFIIIEVQSGSYLGEDDILRFEDNYGSLKLKKNNLNKFIKACYSKQIN